jgi:FAD/FMN-containing dehydrogenase
MPVDQETIDQFAQQLRGTLIDRDNPGYDDARKVYNGMIDRKPLLIARCADVADVIACVNFAREHQLLVAVRGGGHNGPGLGVCDDGLVIDLSMMDGIRVDPEAKTVRVEGGALLGAVDHATHAFGMAIPSGIIASTGVGGLTLGGGIGHLTRKAGLSIDHLLEADVVLADGSLVVASKDQHDDLFWAIRGGGGNFGVVVSFLFSLEPISTVYAGPMLWTLDKATEVLSWYRDFLPAQPDDLNGFFAFISVPPGPPFPEELHGMTMCGIVWCYTGPLDQAESVFAPIRARFGAPALDWVGPIPHPALQGMFDPLYVTGLQWYWKADFFKEINDEAVAQFVAHGSSLPTGLSTMHLYPVDGAASRVPADATPWAYRDAKWAGVIVGVSPDPADKDRITKWARDYWNATHPYSAGGAYINFMMEEGADRVRATYGANYDRLAAIKKSYDPTNLFRVNQNIKPV